MFFGGPAEVHPSVKLLRCKGRSLNHYIQARPSRGMAVMAVPTPGLAAAGRQHGLLAGGWGARSRRPAPFSCCPSS